MIVIVVWASLTVNDWSLQIPLIYSSMISSIRSAFARFTISKRHQLILTAPSYHKNYYYLWLILHGNCFWPEVAHLLLLTVHLQTCLCSQLFIGLQLRKSNETCTVLHAAVCDTSSQIFTSSLMEEKKIKTKWSVVIILKTDIFHSFV